MSEKKKREMPKRIHVRVYRWDSLCKLICFISTVLNMNEYIANRIVWFPSVSMGYYTINDSYKCALLHVHANKFIKDYIAKISTSK